MRALMFMLVGLLIAVPASPADDRIKQVSVAGIGFLFLPKTVELTEVHFSVSHRLSVPVDAITFGLMLHNPSRTTLKTEQVREAFRYVFRGKSPRCWDSRYHMATCIR